MLLIATLLADQELGKNSSDTIVYFSIQNQCQKTLYFSYVHTIYASERNSTIIVLYVFLSQMLHWNEHKEECARLEEQMKHADFLNDFPFTFSMEATRSVTSMCLFKLIAIYYTKITASVS